MLPAHRLSIAKRDFLESMVSMDEIKAAVWDCGSQKAPGPDGYSFMFIKKFWDLLKHDIQSFVVYFFSNATFPQGSNSAFIMLILKVSNPLLIKDYRPISLIGIHYKIVAKILANRLFKVIYSIISPEQFAFITEWQILDSPLILSETIDLYKKRKKKMMLFKVDFEKAFDSVSWRTSILIYGNPKSEFSLKRGLRQGDPLSPFLFIIVMEGLHMALNDGLAVNMFHGITVGSPGMHLSHLFYANDVIVLSEWNLNVMENIIRILNIFYIAFGLKINIHKSNVYGVGVSSNEVEIMAFYTGCEAGFFSFIYLGLPISSNMTRISNWQPPFDRFKARLSGWKANLLSIGGRLTLIKSMLGSLGIYYLSIFKVSETVVKSLESLRASFFWGSSKDYKKLAWVKWSNILASLDKEGLSVGSLKAFNMRFMVMKQVLILEVVTLMGFEPKELVDSDTCIWSLFHDDKFSVNSVRKHIDELSLLSLSPNLVEIVYLYLWVIGIGPSLFDVFGARGLLGDLCSKKLHSVVEYQTVEVAENAVCIFFRLIMTLAHVIPSKPFS
ncbi:putative RNA-directed DNA polymerase, eukaryota, reverse transcriptase zinc-binding domain protein [Tanacetum coccineum]